MHFFPRINLLHIHWQHLQSLQFITDLKRLKQSYSLYIFALKHFCRKTNENPKIMYFITNYIKNILIGTTKLSKMVINN